MVKNLPFLFVYDVNILFLGSEIKSGEFFPHSSRRVIDEVYVKFVV